MHEEMAAGLTRSADAGPVNLHWQAPAVHREQRAALSGQRGGVVWLTGLSGAGKSTIAREMEACLHARGRHAYVLDGDNVRHGLCRDLGFSEADRAENVRRIAEAAKLMADAGLVVIVACIAPLRADRQCVRDILRTYDYFEIFVDAPLAVAEARDPKGLYRKARRGELRGFTGIDAPYEPPPAPDLRLDTTCLTAAQAAAQILVLLMARGVIPRPTAAPAAAAAH